jgi:pantoate--beta-alanine ligase
MRIINSLDNILLELKKHKGKKIGFVPTMGALHQGHLSLIRKARKDNDTVVVSIFVNPKQFGPGEDLNRYPRPIEKDISFCRKEKVDILFYPEAKDIYPKDFSTYISLEGLSNILCGKSRPDHFKGVSTIVAKLLNIIRPDVIYLGQKDAQQAVIIKRMVVDLNIPVVVKVIPIVRDKDGLAISSRNIYLSKSQRKDALTIPYAFNLAKELIKNGTRNSSIIVGRMKQLILKNKSVIIDYIEIVDADSLKPLKKVTNNSLIMLAVFIGKARLIDNCQVKRWLN